MTAAFNVSSEWTSTANYWNNRYLNKETGWDRGLVHPALTNWMNDGALTPCRILVPGCGNGHEVIQLAAAGFDVTAIDFAERPLDSLRQKLNEANAEANLVQKDLFEYVAPTPFDAIYEQTCLCALEPAARPSYEARIHELLKTDGKLFALFMQAEPIEQGPPFHCDMDEMKKLFPSLRWSWLNDSPQRYEHPNAPIFELANILVKI